MIRLEIEAEPMSSRTATSSDQERNEAPKEFRNHESERRIQQTITYMMEHVNQSLQVAKLAAMANMSPSHYTALFKRRTGCAPIDYFTRLRMRHACDLLTATSLIVKEVAAALGYEDRFYFSRLFKSVNGVAPSYYRETAAVSRPADGNLMQRHSKITGALSFPHFPLSKQSTNISVNGKISREQNDKTRSMSECIRAGS